MGPILTDTVSKPSMPGNRGGSGRYPAPQSINNAIDKLVESSRNIIVHDHFDVQVITTILFFDIKSLFRLVLGTCTALALALRLRSQKVSYVHIRDPTRCASLFSLGICSSICGAKDDLRLASANIEPNRGGGCPTSHPS